MILVDDRAGSRELVKYRPLNDRSTSVLARLEFGDVAFVGNGPNGQIPIGIEFKRLSDLIQSVDSGRFQSHQYPGMARDYDRVFLLYQGTYKVGDDGFLKAYRRGKWVNHPSNKTFAWMERFFLTCSELGIVVKHVNTMQEAAYWIYYGAYKYFSKPYDKHTSFRVFDRSRVIKSLYRGTLAASLPASSHDHRALLRANVASQIPSLGVERALKAARHFPSVRKMINADESEWQEVEGIGKVIAKSIVESVS